PKHGPDVAREHRRGALREAGSGELRRRLLLDVDPEREVALVLRLGEVLWPEEADRLLGDVQPGEAVIDPRVEGAERGRVLLRERACLLRRLLVDRQAPVLGERCAIAPG